MIVGHLHVVLCKGVAQALVHLKISVPVGVCRRPAADGVFDGAGTVIREIHRRRGFFQHGGEGENGVHAGLLHLVRRRVVGCCDLVDDAAAAQDGEVDDLRAGHFAVGLEHDLSIRRFDLRVRQ